MIEDKRLYNASTDESSVFYLEECGSCGCYHRPQFSGDCRDDSERFPYSDALVGMFKHMPEVYNQGSLLVRTIWDTMRHKGSESQWKALEEMTIEFSKLLERANE